MHWALVFIFSIFWQEILSKAIWLRGAVEHMEGDLFLPQLLLHCCSSPASMMRGSAPRYSKQEQYRAKFTGFHHREFPIMCITYKDQRKGALCSLGASPLVPLKSCFPLFPLLCYAYFAHISMYLKIYKTFFINVS